MAEFDNADGARRRGDEGAPRRLPEDGRLSRRFRSRSSTRRSICKRTRLPAAGPARRHLRRAWRLRPGVLGLGDRVSDEHRRPSAQQLAAVHSGDVRDDGARRGADLLRRHVGAEQAAAAVSPGLQRCRRSRAPRPIGSSSSSRRPTRASSAMRRGSSSRGCIQ